MLLRISFFRQHKRKWRYIFAAPSDAITVVYRRRNGTKRKFFNDFSRARMRVRAREAAFGVCHLGLETGMDLGWIVTFVSSKEMTRPQVSVAIKGGGGTAVLDLSIEVDDLNEAVHRIQAAGFVVEYGPTTEEWGVRRFYVRDPFGKLLNILSHT